MFVVIAYDVVEDRRRNRVFRTLKNHGWHVQYSVFECQLNQRVFNTLATRLERMINPAEDNLRFYFLDQKAVSQIKSVGQGRTISPEQNIQCLIL